MANNGSVQFIVRARLTSEAVTYPLPMSQGLWRIISHCVKQAPSLSKHFSGRWRVGDNFDKFQYFSTQSCCFTLKTFVLLKTTTKHDVISDGTLWQSIQLSVLLVVPDNTVYFNELNSLINVSGEVLIRHYSSNISTCTITEVNTSQYLDFSGIRKEKKILIFPM